MAFFPNVQIWFADDAAGSNKLTSLHNWWNDLEEHGPKYGHFVNGEKTWLVTKGDNLENAKKVFPVQMSTLHPMVSGI